MRGWPAALLDWNSPTTACSLLGSHCFPHRPCWDYGKPKSGSGFSLCTSPTDKKTILLSYNSLSPTKQGLLSESSQLRPEPRGDRVSSGPGHPPGQPALA